LRSPLAVLPSSTSFNVSADGVVELALGAGETATIVTAGTPASDVVVTASPMAEGDANFWGCKPRPT